MDTGDGQYFPRLLVLILLILSTSLAFLFGHMRLLKSAYKTLICALNGESTEAN